MRKVSLLLRHKMYGELLALKYIMLLYNSKQVKFMIISIYNKKSDKV